MWFAIIIESLKMYQILNKKISLYSTS